MPVMMMIYRRGDEGHFFAMKVMAVVAAVVSARKLPECTQLPVKSGGLVETGLARLRNADGGSGLRASSLGAC